MPSFRFVGADPIDHFHAGRVAPGDVVQLDECPPGPWEAVKPRPRRAQGAEQASPRTEHGSDAPDASEED